MPRKKTLFTYSFADKMDAMMEKLSCERREMRVYHKHHAPLRWHLGAQRRIEDVVLDLDEGFQVDFDGSYEPDEGDHGYDNLFHTMNVSELKALLLGFIKLP